MIYSKLARSFFLPSFFLTALAFPQLHSPPMTEPKIRGVNLGGWLLTEPWITPSIYDNAAIIFPVDPPKDEWTLCEKYGKDRCLQVLRHHWETFVTEDDFRQIKDAGLTHVRIPIGYWAIHPRPGDLFVQGSLEYFERALGWARQHGLKVFLDLHGAPSGQNGMDNCGRVPMDGIPTWKESPASVVWTQDTIQKLTDRYFVPGTWKDTLTGFGILNEPYNIVTEDQKTLLNGFNREAYRIVHSSSPSTEVIISDSNLNPDFWSIAKLDLANGFDIFLDLHPYFCFAGRNVAMVQNNAFIDNACRQYNDIRLKRRGRRIIIGEWSAAYTDCTKYLWGFRTGSKMGENDLGGPVMKHPECDRLYTGSVSQFTEEQRVKTRKFVEAQLHTWNVESDGWFFWTWKTESGAPGWDLRDLINNGLFPRHVLDLQYPGVCDGKL